MPPSPSLGKQQEQEKEEEEEQQEQEEEEEALSSTFPAGTCSAVHLGTNVPYWSSEQYPEKY